MIWIKVGIVFSLLTVAIGAFGAHGLKEILARNETDDVFQTGVRYQMFHSLALLFAGLLLHLNVISKTAPHILFTAGIVIFSGSLYVLAITKVKWLGAITPIGGLAFIGGWALLLFALR